jgi:hypothetical protein
MTPRTKSLIFLALFVLACCVESIPGSWLAHLNTGVLILCWIAIMTSVPFVWVRI